MAVHRYLNVLFTAARHRGDVCEVVMLTVTVSVEVVSLSHGAAPGAVSCERDNRPSATDVLGRKRRARRAETCGRQLRGVTREDGAAAHNTLLLHRLVCQPSPAQLSPAQPSPAVRTQDIMNNAAYHQHSFNYNPRRYLVVNDDATNTIKT